MSAKPVARRAWQRAQTLISDAKGRSGCGFAFPVSGSISQGVCWPVDRVVARPLCLIVSVGFWAQAMCFSPGPWQASQPTLISDHVVS